MQSAGDAAICLGFEFIIASLKMEIPENEPLKDCVELFYTDSVNPETRTGMASPGLNQAPGTNLAIC